MAFQRIRFQGEEWLLIGGDTITTREAYKAFACSHAHVGEDGVVRRFGKEIGRAEEIEVLGEIPDEEVEAATIVDVLENWHTWSPTR